MRLARWTVHFYRLPYRREVTWAYATENSSDYVLLRLIADDGVAGIVEGVVKPNRTGYSPRSLVAALEEVVLPQLQGVDLLDENAVAEALRKVPDNRHARGLVDNACWAMRAAARREPLWRSLGGAPEVELSWIVTRRPPALMAAEAAEMCERYGLRSLKIKGGQGRETDLRVIAEVRAAVGPVVELSMDANGAYPRDGIASYAKAIADAGIVVVEDPCPLAPDRAFEDLVRDCPVPLLVDFACLSREDAALFLERSGRALMIKPGRIGFSESRAIDKLCAARGAAVSLGMYYESALGTALSLQCAAGLVSRLILPPEHSFFLMLKQNVMNRPLEIVGGKLRLPEEPDLSQLVDWKTVEKLGAELRP